MDIHDRPDREFVGTALEKHYRVREIADLWGFSYNVISALFKDEPGVIRLETPGAGKRRYVSLSIPGYIVSRVHERVCNKPIKVKLPARNPPRIVRLADLQARMTEKL